MNRYARSLLAGAARLSVGYGLIRVDELLFDFIFYPYMLLSGGPALARLCAAMIGLSPTWASQWGGAVGFTLLLAVSAAANIAYVRVYDHLQTDWFGIEKIREWDERLVKWKPYGFLRAPAGAFAFVLVSVWQNPLLAILLFRSRDSRFRMGKPDWGLFALAILTANLGWTAVVLAASAVVSWCTASFGWRF